MSSSSYHTPTLTLSASAPAQLDTDMLVVPVFEDHPLAEVAELDVAVGQELTRARARGEFRVELYDTFSAPITATGWRAARALFVGLGKRRDVDTGRLRRVATTAGLFARQRRASRMGLVVGEIGLPVDLVAQAVAEGLALANFEAGSYKTAEQPSPWIEHAVVVVPRAGASAEQALERGRVIGECSNVTRSLANEPGNRLTPSIFAERASAAAAGTGLAIEVLDEHRIRELKMGLLLAVAQGSEEPPRVITMRYEPKVDAVPGVVLGLVGKGITFDTGGISLKPAEKMERMKDDMSGGAAVLGAMLAIARLGAPVRCVGLIAASENMPGGRAVKPGDVVMSAEGKSVEIINTDAEGRLVLGDALWFARTLGVTHLFDIATLTGGCMVALGLTTAGLFGSPTTWRDEVQRATERAGERSWPLPDFPDYMELIKSDVADFANSGARWGSASVGAVFVKEFTGGLPWAHLDIAGPAWAEENKPYQVKGATGIGVRTMVELAFAAQTWGKS